MLCLKELTLIADFKLSGKLFQVVGPAQDKLWIPSFVFRKGSFKFFVGRARNYAIITNRIKNFVKIVRTLIAVKFNNIGDNES